MSQIYTDDVKKVLDPAFKAIDNLRVAIDAAQEAGDDEIAAALIWAMCDVADTIDLIDGMLKRGGRGSMESSDGNDTADLIDLVVR